MRRPCESAIDCNAAPGSSGAALTTGHNIVGIYLGYRSSDPARAQPFSATHYNFAITVEGPLRRALLAAAHEIVMDHNSFTNFVIARPVS